MNLNRKMWQMLKPISRRGQKVAEALAAILSETDPDKIQDAIAAMCLKFDVQIDYDPTAEWPIRIPQLDLIGRYEP